MPKRTLRTLAAATLLAAAALTAGIGKATASTGVKVVMTTSTTRAAWPCGPAGSCT
jgi:hypothetical protein